MDSRELNLLRKQTAQYIAENPSEVVVARRTKVPDGAGGSTYTEADRPPQTVRFIQRSQSAQVERRNVDGEVVRPSLVMMAKHDADLVMGDKLVWEGNRMEVVWITNLDYELLADLAVR